MQFNGSNAGAILRKLRDGPISEVARVAKNALSLHTDAELNNMFSDALSVLKRKTGGNKKSRRNMRGGGVKLSRFFAIFFLLMIQSLTRADSMRRDCSVVPDGWFTRSTAMQACLDYNANLDKSNLAAAEANARESKARADAAEADAAAARGRANEAAANEASARERANAEKAQLELDRQLAIETTRLAKEAAIAELAVAKAKSAVEAAKAKKEEAEFLKEAAAVEAASKVEALKLAASFEQTRAQTSAAMRYSKAADAADAARYQSNTLSTICATLLACVVSVAGTSYVFTNKMNQMRAAIMGQPLAIAPAAPLAIAPLAPVAAAAAPAAPVAAVPPPLPPGPPPAVVAATPPMPSPATLAAGIVYIPINPLTQSNANGYYGPPRFMDPGDPADVPFQCHTHDEARIRSWRGYRIYAQTAPGVYSQIHTYNDLAAAPAASLFYGWTNNPAVAGGSRRRRNRRQRKTRR